MPVSHTPQPARILLVEDHGDTADVTAKLLRHSGHQVSVACTVAGATALAALERFDVLLCDIGLPDGDGHELLQKVLKLYPVYGIAVSGLGMPADLERSQRAGFAAHLIKPVKLEDLLNAIERHRMSRASAESGESDSGIPVDR